MRRTNSWLPKENVDASDAQLCDSMDTQTCVDHCVRVVSHPACSYGMIDCAGSAADFIRNFICALTRTIDEVSTVIFAERGRRANSLGDLNQRDQSFKI